MEENDNNTWRSCSGCQIDRRATVFFSQLGLSTILVLFSCYQLTQAEDCHTQQTYIGLLTMCIGLFLPSPRISKQ